jgi:hypothetical protein
LGRRKEKWEGNNRLVMEGRCVWYAMMEIYRLLQCYESSLEQLPKERKDQRTSQRQINSKKINDPLVENQIGDGRVLILIISYVALVIIACDRSGEEDLIGT